MVTKKTEKELIDRIKELEAENRKLEKMGSSLLLTHSILIMSQEQT
jgi:hypothetical protein